MSIMKMRAELKEPALTMRYEDGGKIEVWSTATKTVRTRAGASASEVRTALQEAPLAG